MDEIFKGNVLRTLLLLSKKQDYRTTPNGTIQYQLNLSQSEFLYVNKLIGEKKLASTSMTDACLLPLGRQKLNEYLEAELMTFNRTLRKFNFDFALIEFIYNREFLDQYELPTELIDMLPSHAKGAGMLGSVLQVAHNNPQYIDCRNDGILTLTRIGKIYYEEEIENASMPTLSHSPVFHIGDNISITGNENKVATNKSEIKETTSTSKETSFWKKIRDWFFKPIVGWIAGLFILGIGLLISQKRCSQATSPHTNQSQQPKNLDTTSRK